MSNEMIVKPKVEIPEVVDEIPVELTEEGQKMKKSRETIGKISEYLIFVDYCR